MDFWGSLVVLSCHSYQLPVWHTHTELPLFMVLVCFCHSLSAFLNWKKCNHKVNEIHSIGLEESFQMDRCHIILIVCPVWLTLNGRNYSKCILAVHYLLYIILVLIQRPSFPCLFKVQVFEFSLLIVFCL